MKDLFIPYEQAIYLKNLGLNEPCLAYYNGDPSLKNPCLNMVKPFEHEWCIPAPLYQQAFRFFRLQGYLIDLSSHDKYLHDFFIRLSPNSSILSNIYSTYEEMELACIIELIEISKNNK